ncbi:hypothetical protein NHX12_029686 [Muraenolepis orangiensis]|uniref:Uncharacterized protein n=1 Tax=Muraenolepis orangiensis TaxID=630683 RepID=A0A9Q0EAN6_9TELE|nr:hypothetical protein NHX12_029686 [Muraenolepis orangiensis]
MTDTTTANDVFHSLVGALDELEVDWSRAVSVATDGAPSMIGRKAGVVVKLREKGRNKLVTEYYDSVRAFQGKLVLWQTQLSKRNAAHFPCLKSQPVNHQSMDKYANLLSGLRHEFDNRFTVFTELEKDFSLFRSPFTVDASVVPEAMQMELIELQCCAPLKDTYASVAIEVFYQSLPPQYPMLTAFAGGGEEGGRGEEERRG